MGVEQFVDVRGEAYAVVEGAQLVPKGNFTRKTLLNYSNLKIILTTQVNQKRQPYIEPDFLSS
jgi:hypothetical protein